MAANYWEGVKRRSKTIEGTFVGMENNNKNQNQNNNSNNQIITTEDVKRINKTIQNKPCCGG